MWHGVTMLGAHTANEEGILKLDLESGGYSWPGKKNNLPLLHPTSKAFGMSPLPFGTQRLEDGWLLREFPGMFQKGIENILSQFQSEK